MSEKENDRDGKDGSAEDRPDSERGFVPSSRHTLIGVSAASAGAYSINNKRRNSPTGAPGSSSVGTGSGPVSSTVVGTSPMASPLSAGLAAPPSASPSLASGTGSAAPRAAAAPAAPALAHNDATIIPARMRSAVPAPVASSSAGSAGSAGRVDTT